MVLPSFHTPILFIVFNRPEPTKIVFEKIRSIQPEKLFIFADGPRSNIPTDVKRCTEVREIVSQIDWKCNYQTQFQENNLGCGLGPISAISWFFEHVDEGIILEDDCLPSISFFKYCEILLEYYRNNSTVMHISGDNFQYGKKRGKSSYYFSRYTHSWGWATWKRAWNYYDYELLPFEYRIHSWDKQWELSVEKAQGLSILPNKNLVKNIGFGADATHTKNEGRYSFLNAEEIDFPLIHPANFSLDKKADEFTEFTHFRNVKHEKLIFIYKIRNNLNFLWEKIRNKLKSFVAV
jgi:hypothetical protein